MIIPYIPESAFSDTERILEPSWCWSIPVQSCFGVDGRLDLTRRSDSAQARNLSNNRNDLGVEGAAWGDDSLGWELWEATGQPPKRSALVWRSPRFRRLSPLFASSVISESFFDPLTWSLDSEMEITHLIGLPWWLKENIPRVRNKCWPGVQLIHPSFREATTSDGVWWPCWESHFCGLRFTILWCMNLTRTLSSFPWDYFIVSQKQRDATSFCETPHTGHTWWNIY